VHPAVAEEYHALWDALAAEPPGPPSDQDAPKKASGLGDEARFIAQTRRSFRVGRKIFSGFPLHRLSGLFV